MEEVARKSAMKQETIDDDSVEFQPNTTPVPNVILDWMMAGLNGAQFKVLMFFVRQKYGFASKRSDPSVEFEFNISTIQNGIAFKLKLPEGDKTWKRVCLGTGLSRDAVSSAIKDLSRFDYLEITRQGNRKVAYKIKVKTAKINNFKATDEQVYLDENTRQSTFGRKLPPIENPLAEKTIQKDTLLDGKTFLLGNQVVNQVKKKSNHAIAENENTIQFEPKQDPQTESHPNPKQSLVPGAAKSKTDGDLLWDSLYAKDKSIGMLPLDSDAGGKVIYFKQGKVKAESIVKEDGLQAALEVFKFAYGNKYCQPVRIGYYKTYKARYMAEHGGTGETIDERNARLIAKRQRQREERENQK